MASHPVKWGSNYRRTDQDVIGALQWGGHVRDPYEHTGDFRRGPGFQRKRVRYHDSAYIKAFRQPYYSDPAVPRRFCADKNLYLFNCVRQNMGCTFPTDLTHKNWKSSFCHDGEDYTSDHGAAYTGSGSMSKIGAESPSFLKGQSTHYQTYGYNPTVSNSTFDNPLTEYQTSQVVGAGLPCSKRSQFKPVLSILEFKNFPQDTGSAPLSTAFVVYDNVEKRSIRPSRNISQPQSKSGLSSKTSNTISTSLIANPPTSRNQTIGRSEFDEDRVLQKEDICEELQKGFDLSDQFEAMNISTNRTYDTPTYQVHEKEWNAKPPPTKFPMRSQPKLPNAASYIYRRPQKGRVSSAPCCQSSRGISIAIQAK